MYVDKIISIELFEMNYFAVNRMLTPLKNNIISNEICDTYATGIELGLLSGAWHVSKNKTSGK